ncbi:glycopeptide antibiotics resistance protein [Desulfitobacterium dichloroeliminans LMG P-21439]|uniref:Glycopeptide antibiotics resistance protein n=1 Tax=Desulfitobacterium dichloroeliminans (strain LMG P-21439 / DCA1) TaxID=871963 RepID=L0F3U6_DESDL|nr:VanZ family protein [Desulfitobacterium dichloroeliminans]AGA67852.1 glycopeptide antibiotics resistance protein [Desulfitobacterium dichloroeliminans LMG P-21439]
MLLLISIVIFKLPFYGRTADEVRVINLIPLGGSFDENGVLVLREIVYNIIFFIPLGIYICMLKGAWSFKKKVLPIIGVTLGFEAVQFIFAMGRSDITDLLGNTLGGIIGIGIYALLWRILNNRTVTAVNLLALAVTVCALLPFTYLFYLSHFVMGRPPL